MTEYQIQKQILDIFPECKLCDIEIDIKKSRNVYFT
jgi:hypothetical protein